MGTRKDAVVLLSGGLDSTTVVAIAKHQGFTVNAITFRYGQRHVVEIEAARRVASRFGVLNHLVVDFDLHRIGGSSLTAFMDVPKNRDLSQSDDIPSTYVPARNTIFLSFALAWAEVLGANDIFVGVNAVDYSGYPDCRPEYIAAYERMANLATRSSVEGALLSIHAPLIHMTKREIIDTGLRLGVDYSITTTCYDPDTAGMACGSCDACALRLRGFQELGISDPIPYTDRRIS